MSNTVISTGTGVEGIEYTTVISLTATLIHSRPTGLFFGLTSQDFLWGLSFSQSFDGTKGFRS